MSGVVFEGSSDLCGVEHHRNPKPNNPFGATMPNEVPCIESRPLPTRQDGTVWIYMAMDAHSRFAFHHTIKAQSILPEYISFIMEVYRKHPELKKATLVVDTPPAMESAFRKLFSEARKGDLRPEGSERGHR